MRVPSSEYLGAASQVSALLSDPSKSRKLLVLDLNGTLLVRSKNRPTTFDGHRRSRKRRRLGRERDGNDTGINGSRSEATSNSETTPPPSNRFTVQPRPYMRTFREYLAHPSTRTWLDTMIWSSARPENVGYMVDACFGQQREGLIDVWARDKIGLSKQQYDAKSQTTKDLVKPWRELRLLATSAPSTSHHLCSALSTLLLDDSPSKAVIQPFNHLCVHEYTSTQLASDREHANLLRTGDTRAQQIDRLRDRIQRQKEESVSLKSNTATSTFPSLPSDLNSQGKSRNPLPSPEKMMRDRAVKLAKEVKRKEKKLAKLELLVNENKIDGSTASSHTRYDETLLAVIGVLDTIRWQSNIASWIKTGGLHGQPSDGTPELNTPLTVSPWKGGKTGISVDTLSAPSEPPLWFADPQVFHSWVQRGVKALDELGISLIAGADEST